MKSLKISIKESFFDDIEDITSSDFDEKIILDFLKENYAVNLNKISIRSGDSKLIVDVNDDISVKNRDLEYLTNNLFKFGVINGGFTCDWCENIVSFEGGPEKVIRFVCYSCNKLTSLKGAPKIVMRDFCCINCKNLISLKGAPKVVGGYFNCSRCKNLISLKGAPEKVDNWFDCSYCLNLKSLEDSPKKIGKHFYCFNCPNLTSLKGAPDVVPGFVDCRNCPKLIITTTDRKKYNIKDK